MRVLITGADGFLGKNLYQHLSERADIEIVTFTKKNSPCELPHLLNGINFIFHLAGVNRSDNEENFYWGNEYLTNILSGAIKDAGRSIPVIYASSVHARLRNKYGHSKQMAENILLSLGQSRHSNVHIFRLPNVFGKWAKPNYNSVVATFCHNISRDLPIEIHDPDAVLKLVYVDDVVERFIQLMDGVSVSRGTDGFEILPTEYTITVGNLAKQLKAFKKYKSTLLIDHVGVGLVRALYATYVSYLPVSEFSYDLPEHRDSRGIFVEMLKTKDSGQVSYFTIRPGITRGGHYHHSKTEKFLVLKGSARFTFKQIVTGENFELISTEAKSMIVQSIPGWAHDITNIGDHEVIVMLWANELFDESKPDTYLCRSEYKYEKN